MSEPQSKLTPEQQEALERALAREKKKPQEQRVKEQSAEEKRGWGITTDTASEQAKKDEAANPSKE